MKMYKSIERVVLSATAIECHVSENIKGQSLTFVRSRPQDISYRVKGHVIVEGILSLLEIFGV